MVQKQKIYCYVDETGQDVGSPFFVVVAVISSGDQNQLREILEDIEKETKIFKRKWYRAGHEQRQGFLNSVIQKNGLFVTVFYQQYKKPVLYFSLWVEVIYNAIIKVAKWDEYIAKIFVDGIDRKKAAELTGSLRLRGLKLTLVQGRRDETDALIRLADRWAGCVRSGKEGDTDLKRILSIAEKSGMVTEIKTTP